MVTHQSMQRMGTLLAGLSLLCLGMAGRAAEPVPSMAPPNPAFVAYQARLAEQRRDRDGRFGHRPSPVDLSHLTAQAPAGREGAAARSLPARFDWRTADPAKLSPVRNQDPYNTCWTFATYASLESFLRPAETPNYSERHMVLTHGWDWGYGDGGGGNHLISTAYLARWGGPVDEADCPYSGMPAAPEGAHAVRKQVQRVLFYPSPVVTDSAAMELVKEAIMAHGALYVDYYHDDTYYRSANRAYYHPDAPATNHAVAVVGWDDDFAATKFGATPPGNGAWILRNSWGGGWGDGGYFYLSYHDSGFQSCTPARFTAAPEAGNYTHIHQHDPLGWVGSFGYGVGKAVWGANVFSLNGDEVLKAVAFYTAGRNVSYDIRVYRNLASNSPVSGTLCGIGTGGATVLSGTLAEAGYHTVVLPTAVPLEAPQDFSVVVKLSDPVSAHSMAMEYLIPETTSAASAEPNQSFYSSNGSGWTDLTSFRPTANFCIKAFTDDPPPAIDVLGGIPPQSIPDGNSTPSAEDGTWFGRVTVGESLAHTFTIRNEGGPNLVLTGDPRVEVGGGEAGDYAVTSPPASPLAPGETTTFEITFAPATAGDRSATVSIASNDPDKSPYTFALEGSGVPPPVALDDQYETIRNVALAVAAPGVLANDFDAEDGILTAGLIDAPNDGTVTLAADGGFTYTPDPDFVGTDSFTYRASADGRHSNTATVTLAVARTPQTIDFAPIGTKIYGEAPFGLIATATSGLPVVFASSDPAVAIVEDGTVTIVGAGTATITANQAGDALWSPAPEASRLLTVRPVFALAVENGTGAGSYPEGTVVSVAAEQRVGWRFVQWIAAPAGTGVGLADATASPTDFAMPAGEVVLTATYDYADPLWSVQLDLAPAGSESLVFGMHEIGSDGWEEGLDLPAGDGDRAHLASADLAVRHAADFRGPAGAGEFLLVVEALGEPVTLAWDTPLLPEGKFLTLYEVSLAGRDPLARDLVGNTALDMAATRTLAVPAETTRHYVIRYSDELVFDLAFHQGWNLLSLPIEPLLPSVGDVLASDGEAATIHAGSVLAWDGADYAEVSVMEPCIGYWVHAVEPTVRLIEGMPVPQDELVLGLGLNLLGPARARAVPTHPALVGPVWVWDAETMRYRPAESLHPGLGHWFQSNAADHVPLDDR